MLAALLGGVLAMAPPTGTVVELHWHAPPSCPSETEVATSLASRLEPTTGTDDRVVADIVVARDGDVHVADLVVTTRAGRTERRLEAPTCETVADAAVLIVAMVHAQTYGAPVVPTAPVTEVAPVTAAAPPVTPTRQSTSTPEPAPASRLRGSAFAEIAVGFAGLPRVGPGLGGGLALLGRRFRAEIVGAFWFAREAPIGLEEQDASVDVRLWTVGAHAGPVLRAGPVEFALLVGGHGGLAHGEGDGVAISRSSRRPWLSLGAYPMVLWPLHRVVALGLRGSVEAVVVRPSFAVREGGTQFTASGVTGSLAAVVEVRFP
jgi:hypothetical protein